jgi:hypothetical protein
VSKKLLIMAATFLSATSFIACNQLPQFPTVEAKLVDNAHAKLHRYNLPKERGQNPEFLGSIALDTSSIEKHYCFSARGISNIQNYISAVEDIARQRCR